MPELIATITCTLFECAFKEHFGKDFKDGIGIKPCLLCRHAEIE